MKYVLLWAMNFRLNFIADTETKEPLARPRPIGETVKLRCVSIAGEDSHGIRLYTEVAFLTANPLQPKALRATGREGQEEGKQKDGVATLNSP